MDKSLQKKLVGAAVLIALAVIFLPMLLNGKNEPDTISMQIEIPPKPVYEVPNRLEQPAATEATAGSASTSAIMSQRAAVGLDPVTAENAAAQVAAPQVTQVPAAAAAGSAVTAAVPVPKTSAAKVLPKVAKLQAPSAPVQNQAASGAGYVVQVGSFGKHENALRLKDKLAGAGFPVFVEQYQGSQGSIFRVKVGPRPDRNAVDELRIRLVDEASLEGIIVSHP